MKSWRRRSWKVSRVADQLVKIREAIVTKYIWGGYSYSEDPENWPKEAFYGGEAVWAE